MHRALVEVARDHDKERDEERRFTALDMDGGSREVELHLPDHMIASAGQARRFATTVARSMEGGVLRYSVRMELLSDASRRGIGRFEANLIIAAVQHQMGSAGEEDVHRNRGFRAPPLVIALLIEAAVIAGVWMAM